MRVLLTGAAGFIGSQVDTLLSERGDEVVAVDALIPQAHGADAASWPALHRLDVRDAAQWSELLDGVDVVCHQAAVVGAGTTPADLPLYAAHNDLGTAALLAAMSERGVGALVLASSMVVYGEGRYACARHGVRPPGSRAVADLRAGRFEHRCPECGDVLGWQVVPEDARLDPRSSYAASKVAQEHYASAWARQAGGRAVALRYHNVYGPGMPRDTPYSGVAAIFRSSLERGLPPQVFEDGAQARDFVHVHDIARANVLAIDRVRGAEAGSWATYNVCSGTPITILEVAELLARASGGPAPEVTGDYRAGDVRHVVASPDRAARELGFAAAVPPEEGITQLASAPLR